MTLIQFIPLPFFKPDLIICAVIFSSHEGIITRNNKKIYELSRYATEKQSFITYEFLNTFLKSTSRKKKPLILP